MKNTPRNTDANRMKIIDAARRIILEQGIESLSVRKLAGESGLALKTIYNLYGSKENVLVALFESGTQALDLAMERLETAMAQGTWKTQIYLDWLKQVEPVFLENQALIKPAVMVGFSPMPPGPNPFDRLHRRRTQHLKTALELAARKGLIWDDLNLDVSARLLYTNYFNVVVLWAKGELDDRELRVHGRYAILTILHTLINDPKRRENALTLLRKLSIDSKMT